MAPRACILCDRLEIKLEERTTLIQYISNGEVVQTQELYFTPQRGDKIVMTGMHMLVEPKETV